MAKLVLSAALLLLCLLVVTSTAEQFDFFYLVQQWPGSFCDTRQGCCFPGNKKPAADFGIHGLWPNYAPCPGKQGTGSGLARAVLGDDALLSAVVGKKQRGKCWPENCDDGNELLPWEIRDLLVPLERNWGTLSCRNKRSFDFWKYEWKKHGTCSNMDEHEYFSSTLDLKLRHNLTSILAGAGIVPSDTETYFLSSIRDAVAEATGFAPNLECNRDADGESQLFQVYQCVDVTGKELIECPLSMPTKCRTDRVKFPVF